MKCPYCNNSIHYEDSASSAYEYDDDSEEYIKNSVTGFEVAQGFCPACQQLLIFLRDGKYTSNDGYPTIKNEINEKLIYPINNLRKVESEVPHKYKKDYDEASNILILSPKASAALSRRILQNILRDEYRINYPSLAKEIDEFLKKTDIPSYLSQAVDAIRNIGNFAAHPLKDTNTGEIIDVEHGEAEWLLDVLDSLFDFTFIQPKRLEQNKNELNEKLKKIGKPPMK